MLYKGLTVYESNNVGQLFGMSGVIWPSRKPCFQVAEQQASRHFQLRFNGHGAPTVSLPTNGTFNMRDNRQLIEDAGLQFPDIVYGEDFPNAIFNPLHFDPEVALRLGLKDIIRQEHPIGRPSKKRRTQ